MASAEPRFTAGNKIDLIRGLGWYANNSEKSFSRAWALEWLSRVDPAQAKRLNNAPDSAFSNRGYICRMMNRGFEANEKLVNDLKKFFNEIQVSDKVAIQPVQASEKPKIVPVKKLPINTSMSSLDGALMNCIRGKWDNTFEFSHVNRKDLEFVHAYAKALLKDFNDHREDYVLAHIVAMRPVLKKAIEEIDKLVAHIDKNKTRVAVTAPKKINPATMIKLVKYQKEDVALKLKSVALSSVIGCKKLYVYDVSKRRIMCFQASTAQGLVFSGTTIKNWDPSKSTGKTVRKPEEFFAPFVETGSLSVINKLYADIKGKATPILTGRTNDTLIFLKASEQ